MNRLERAETGRKELGQRDLEKIVELLSEQLIEAHPVPPHAASSDTYMSLRPEVKEWLAGADKKKLDRLDGLLDDYGAAQQIGKFIKIFVYALVGMVTTTWGVVKAWPDILIWLRGIIK